MKLKIGITCYPSVGGSGVVGTELGKQLAERGHEILVRVDRHLLVEQRRRHRRAQHHRVAERGRAADVVDVRVRQHHPLDGLA